MSARDFVRSLLPTVDRNIMIKDIERIRNEMKDSTIPSYEASLDVFIDGFAFKDANSVWFSKTYKAMRVKKGKNFIQNIFFQNEQLLENLDVIEKQVGRQFDGDLIRSATTYGRAQLIRLIEATDFVQRYSRLLLLRVMNDELPGLTPVRGKKVALTPIQMKYLNEYRDQFISIMSRICVEPKELESKLKGVPEVIVDPDDESVEVVAGANALDPMLMGITVRRLNPIYHIRMAYEDWMFHRYELAKEERLAIEYQLMDLRNRLANTPDPKIERAIEYTEERLIKLEKKIADMERV